MYWIGGEGGGLSLEVSELMTGIKLDKFLVNDWLCAALTLQGRTKTSCGAKQKMQSEIQSTYFCWSDH